MPQSGKFHSYVHFSIPRDDDKKDQTLEIHRAFVRLAPLVCFVVSDAHALSFAF